MQNGQFSGAVNYEPNSLAVGMPKEAAEAAGHEYTN